MWDRIFQGVLSYNPIFINSEHLNLDFQRSEVKQKETRHSCLMKH